MPSPASEKVITRFLESSPLIEAQVAHFNCAPSRSEMEVEGETKYKLSGGSSRRGGKSSRNQRDLDELLEDALDNVPADDSQRVANFNEVAGAKTSSSIVNNSESKAGSNASSVVKSFVQLMDVKGKPPKERYGHSAVEFEGKMFVFGGCNNKGTFSSDLYIFDIGTRTIFLQLMLFLF